MSIGATYTCGVAVECVVNYEQRIVSSFGLGVSSGLSRIALPNNSARRGRGRGSGVPGRQIGLATRRKRCAEDRVVSARTDLGCT